MIADWHSYCHGKPDVYPRVDYFQRMLSSLLPRFMRVVGYFDEHYQNNKRVRAIEQMVKMLLRSPCVLLKSNTGQFDFLRTAANKRAYEGAKPIQLSSDDLPMMVVVYHCKETSDKFKDELEQSVKGIEEIISILPSYDDHLTKYVLRTDRDVTSRLFIACDSEKQEKELHTFKEEISSELDKLFQDENSIKERLLVGDCAELGVSISMYLESIVFLGFDNIDNYLREFRKHDSSCYKFSKSMTKDERISDFFKYSLADIKSLNLTLKDLLHVTNYQEKTSLSIENEDNLFTIFIVFITFGLKGIVVQILFERFSLSQNLTHECLKKCDFNAMVKTAMEKDDNLKDQIIEIVRPNQSKGKDKVANPTVAKLTDSLIKRLQSVFESVEKEVVTVNQSVEIVKKMSFEISGYYKNTKTRQERTTPKMPFTKELQTDLLRYEDVLGCGFMYSIFEVLIREECKDHKKMEDIIKQLMKQHRYFGQYSIKTAQVNYSLV